jgi:hypothetical protein
MAGKVQDWLVSRRLRILCAERRRTQISLGIWLPLTHSGEVGIVTNRL